VVIGMIEPLHPARGRQDGNLGPRASTPALRGPAGGTARADDAVSLPAVLRAKLVERLGGLLRGVAEVAVVGFPLHPNAGDSLIWLGQLALLESLGITVRVVGEQDSHDGRLFDNLTRDIPVIIAGGGNFGDLWPAQHGYRERVLHEARHHRIIQFPQSFCFRQPSSLSTTQELVSRHKDIVLTWRDIDSYRAGLEAFPDTQSVLVPDVAFALGDLPVARQLRWPIVCVARDDEEGSALRAMPIPGGHHVDWGGATRVSQKLTLNILLVERRSGCRLPDSTRQEMYRRHAKVTIGGAVRLVGGAGVVVSDRLHAHILCMMLGVPHVMLDTRYGKIRSFIETWAADSPLVDLADSPAEALERAQRRLLT
jgi:pyruvyl transferase EpsO